MKNAFLILALILSGCAHSGPRAIQLPTTAAVRAPLVAAQAHVARAVAIGQQEGQLAGVAQTKGIAPGSEQARQLVALVAQDQAEKLAGQNQLTTALYQTGSLQKELDARQAVMDAVVKHDARETAQVGILTKVLHRWKAAAIGLVVGEYLAGAPIQKGLHWLVAFVGRWLLIAWRCIAIPLKAAFPLYLFWLPV